MSTLRNLRSPLRTSQSTVDTQSDEDSYSDIISKLIEMRTNLLRKIRIERDKAEIRDGEGILDSESSKSYSARLLRISDALNRLRHGVYGICKSCEDMIPKQRLLEHPLVRLCEDCQKEGELKLATGRFVR